MEKRRPPELEVLPAKVAERVLKRASELEAVRSAGTDVAQLREAAAEAGISAASFDAALGELNEADEVVSEPLARERRRTKVWAFVAGMGAVILLLGTMIIPRLFVSARIPIAEQAIELNCVSTSDAIDAMKPHLGSTGTVVANPNNPKVLTVRGTPDDVKNAIAAVDQKGGACARY